MKSKNKGIVSGIFKGIIIVLLLVVFILNVYVIMQSKTKSNSVPSIFGYKPFIVLSGSMEPKISVGDLIIVKEVDPSKLKVNDVVAFRDPENFVITHRIINVVEESNDICFETKGDNNNVQDEGLTCSDSIEGKYYSKISKIGNIILFIQNPLGFTIMMMLIFIICIFIYMFESRKVNRQMKLENEKELKEFEEFKKAKELAKKKGND